MDRLELKSMAKGQIRGKIGILFVITLIITGIGLAANLTIGCVPVVGPLVVAIFISPSLTLSHTKVYLGVVQNRQLRAGDAFEGFYDFWTAFKVNFFQALFTILWSLLFVVPGIIKYFSYSMAMYIAAENPGMSALEAVNKSKEMMNGKKMDMFVLTISFLGWYLIGSITFGIAYIWILPYVNTTFANFYNSIKNEYTFNSANKANTFNSEGAAL